VKTVLFIIANGAAIMAGELLASFTVNAHQLRFPPPQIMAMAAVMIGASAGATYRRTRHRHGLPATGEPGRVRIGVK
jgi:hypothetical protein